MRLIVTGGGTGGHLFPGIALAAAMQQKIAGTKVMFIGTARLLDQQALAGLGFTVQSLACGGVKGMSVPQKLWSLLQLPSAVFEARRMMQAFKPDLVFGVGGYVTGPVLVAARSLGVKTGIHEQNSVPGLANRLAGLLAHKICISLPCEPPFPPAKTVLTGNPVRQAILDAAARKTSRTQGAPTLLVLGGSQGAHRVNLLVVEAMRHLAARQEPVRIIHQTGTADEALVRERYRELGIQAEVSAFIKDMAATYRQADFVVSRAGATTLAELAVMGLPALLIPYPFAADNHQVTNGKYYVNGGGCLLLQEADATGEILAGLISERLHNPEELHTMAAKMRALAQPEAADRIVKELCALLPETGGSLPPKAH